MNPQELENHAIKIKEMINDYAQQNDINIMVFGSVANENSIDKKTGSICSLGFNHFVGKDKFANVLLQGIIRLVDLAVKKLKYSSPNFLN